MADKEKAQAPAEAELKKDALSEAPEEIVAVEEELPVAVEVVEEAEPVVVAEEVASFAGVVVDVFEDKIIYENRKNRTSMSVWQVQRRLNELGYQSVRQAKPGYYEAVTLSAVQAYRLDKKLGAGGIDAKFLKSLFAGDKSVNLILA